MPRRYRVIVLPGLEREARQLRKRFPSVYANLLRAVELLETDPFNLQGRANIRKLVDVPAGEGQFCLRLSGYRRADEAMAGGAGFPRAQGHRQRGCRLPQGSLQPACQASRR